MKIVDAGLMVWASEKVQANGAEQGVVTLVESAQRLERSTVDLDLRGRTTRLFAIVSGKSHGRSLGLRMTVTR